jgi:hypothetical protein
VNKSAVRRSSRPYVECLENREQPGFFIPTGFDPSILANSLTGLFSVFDGPVAARVIARSTSELVQLRESGDLEQRPLFQSSRDLNRGIPINSINPGLEAVFGIDAARPDPSATLGPYVRTERPSNAGTRGPELLFYGGDFSASMDDSGLLNGYNMSFADARPYDAVRARGLWTWDCLFSHNLMTYTGVQQAYVHVIGPGKFQEGVPNGGLLDAYPRTLHSATQAFVSNGGFGLIEYEIKACGLNLQLPQGHYYFNVQPVGFGTGASYGATTHGLNGKGSPLYNDDSWFHFPEQGYQWVDTNLPFGNAQNWDFSQGICSAPAC